MPKYTHPSVLDAALTKIATSTKMTLCSALPANYAGISAVALASATIVAGDGNGDWAISAGDLPNGSRKITKSAKTGLLVTGLGTQQSTHVAFDDGTTLLYCTLSTPQDLVNGAFIDTPPFKIELTGPE